MSAELTGESVATQAVEARAVRQAVARPSVRWHRIYPSSVAFLDLFSVLAGGVLAPAVRLPCLVERASEQT